jgi:hypothetical protein
MSKKIAGRKSCTKFKLIGFHLVHKNTCVIKMQGHPESTLMDYVGFLVE